MCPQPLPEKFVMKGMVERFNDDFIETRRKALHRFLNKISAHPILSYSQHLKVFLTAQVSLHLSHTHTCTHTCTHTHTHTLHSLMLTLFNEA